MISAKKQIRKVTIQSNAMRANISKYLTPVSVKVHDSLERMRKELNAIINCEQGRPKRLYDAYVMYTCAYNISLLKKEVAKKETSELEKVQDLLSGYLNFQKQLNK